MLPFLDKRIANFIVIIVLTCMTFLWTFFIFHADVNLEVIGIVILSRMLSSLLIFQDYSLSWSKATPRTFLMKSVVNIVAMVGYIFVLYSIVPIALLVSEMLLYLFIINFAVYAYHFYINRDRTEKTKNVVIYGAGKAGLQLESEFKHSEHKVLFFIDDDKRLQKRSIDNISIISKRSLMNKIGEEDKLDLLVIAMPSADRKRIKEIYEILGKYFEKIQILPSLSNVLLDKPFVKQLKQLTVRELLGRHVQDLDREVINHFVKGKKVLVTGAAGSIGSELVRKCIQYQASEIILLDHSEYSMYMLLQELEESPVKLTPVMMSVINKILLNKVFAKYKPEIVIHAAAYKHVPLVEENIEQAILNNVIGTKNVIDMSIEHGVGKFVLISTDKAVRPTNVMGTTKRICELYMQNVDAKKTSVVAVRFGNVLGSSGSVIPRFQKLINEGKNLTVTDPEMTRYFMLIPEACELVLQAASIGSGGELFILDMGEPIKIVDLANKMIELSGRDDIEIEFTGLRPGEKLYEELLIDESDMHTEYDSIMVAAKSEYDFEKLSEDIEELFCGDNKLEKLKEIVPEFVHKP